MSIATDVIQKRIDEAVNILNGLNATLDGDYAIGQRVSEIATLRRVLRDVTAAEQAAPTTIIDADQRANIERRIRNGSISGRSIEVALAADADYLLRLVDLPRPQQAPTDADIEANAKLMRNGFYGYRLDTDWNGTTEENKNNWRAAARAVLGVPESPKTWRDRLDTHATQLFNLCDLNGSTPEGSWIYLIKRLAALLDEYEAKNDG